MSKLVKPGLRKKEKTCFQAIPILIIHHEEGTSSRGKNDSKRATETLTIQILTLSTTLGGVENFY
ncbi:hypothetical protein BY996DRAFT_6600328 [Phakopsora pachyrhizi]|nr:hypothetical protein BY996DRAFT_6600328 [Phakopsora pachyrhizi]